MANPATLWARTLVAALAQAGLRAVVAAPGSRSTPLVLAFARHPKIAVHSLLDERSAAWFALGMALAQDEPVALLCTSGTAAANFFPAIVEASLTRVPLLVLTADRPPELRESGANQTIDQVRLYGNHVLWSVDCAAPERQPSELALRNLCTLAARAMMVANGLRKGVVHLNLPFRKPLEPDAEDRVAGDLTLPVITSVPAVSTAPTLDEGSLGGLVNLVEQVSNGLIVCGPGCTREFPPNILKDLARVTGWPLIADPLSGLRYAGGNAAVVASADTILAASPAAAPRPDLVLCLGALPTSAALNSWLADVRPPHLIQLSPAGVWADDSHITTGFLQGGAGVLQAICASVSRPAAPSAAATWWLRAEAETRRLLKAGTLAGDWFDGAVIAEILEHLPDDAILFSGNSLPVRLQDQFGMPTGRRLQVHANRGASGIDGNISTALGLGMARPGQRLVAVVGDITFYHDMNGLLALRRLGLNATIVLLNNRGGGIFHRLPASEHEPHFTELFLTPHDLDFRHAARLYGADYRLARDRAAFRTAFQAQMASDQPGIIEVPGDARGDLRQRDAIISATAEMLDGMALAQETGGNC